MSELLYGLGFTPRDVTLMLACAAGAAAGSFVQVVNHYWGDFAELPTRERPSVARGVVAQRFVFLISRLVVGAVLGFLFPLYLIDALQEGLAVTARVLAFSVLIGYVAPRLWEAQRSVVERTVEKIVEQKLKTLLLAGQAADEGNRPLSTTERSGT